MKALKYQPFKTHLYDHSGAALQSMGLIGEYKHLSPLEMFKAIARVYYARGKQFGYAIGDWVFMSEVRYLNSDRFVIFPSSTTMLDSIMRAKLNIQDFDAIKPPAESFVVMMPEGYKTAEGVPMASFLVQWCRTTTNAAKYEHLIKQSGINGFTPAFKDDSMMLDVIALDKNKLALRSSNTASELLRIIDEHDETNAIDKTPDDIRSAPTSEIEKKQMAAMIKLAIGLAIFDSAYDNFLIEGLPVGSKLKKVGQVNLKNAVVMGQNFTHKAPASSKAGHVRAFHFRQLRNERYYQGEHENKPIGSRYVPVSESWIGEDIDSHTTNESAIQ